MLGRAAGYLTVVALSLVSTGFHCGEAMQVKLGEPFELRVGEKVRVEGGELVLTFLAVPQDSRCPKGEQCITAGKARLSFEAAPRNGAAAGFELDTASESEEMDISGFRIALLGLSPYPVSGRPISPQDYLAKILVQR